MPDTVTDSYLIGILEGRAMMSEMKARGEVITNAEMQAFVDNARANIKRGFAREFADVFKGERDFWLNQLKKECDK